MHELSIATEMMEIAEREIARAGAGERRVLKMRLVIGPLSCASSEAVAFAFETLAEGTRFEGAELVVEKPPLTYACAACGFKGETSSPWGSCEKCEGHELHIDGDDALRLASIEVED